MTTGALHTAIAHRTTLTLRNLSWMALARPVARLQFIFISLSFIALVYCFLSNDFSVAYVADNSNSLLPAIYRFSAVWGSHEGSLLLWALILSLWTMAVSIFSKRLPIYFVARVIGVMGSVSIGFLLFMFSLVLALRAHKSLNIYPLILSPLL